MNSINVSNITMKFGDVTALNNINVEFKENKIYGLLGRNGAGKSTLLNVITNRIFPQEGKVYIDGEASCENDHALSKLYCMSEKTLYSESSRVKDVFKDTKIFYPDFDIEYANKLAEKFGLKTKKAIKGLSTGYSSIFKLIIALSVNTPYVLLDEPILGLDANHRDMFYRILMENYSENPRTIIISTHLIEEVTDLLEQVVMIKDGEVIMDIPVEEASKMGYCVSGNSNEVDSYLSTLEVKKQRLLNTETLGGLKTAYLIGEKQPAKNLQIATLDLQKLFIQLTNA